jgi:hypothetical protein
VRHVLAIPDGEQQHDDAEGGRLQDFARTDVRAPSFPCSASPCLRLGFRSPEPEARTPRRQRPRGPRHCPSAAPWPRADVPARERRRPRYQGGEARLHGFRQGSALPRSPSR